MAKARSQLHLLFLFCATPTQHASLCSPPSTHTQDSKWSETGDRYLLKLFRDFVFHQTAPPGHEDEGGPLMDWGHVIEALNKVSGVVCMSAHRRARQRSLCFLLQVSMIACPHHSAPPSSPHQLDAGVLERIMLLSRDESSMLVASYADLKRCVETSYGELQEQASAAAAHNRAAAGM